MKKTLLVLALLAASASAINVSLTSNHASLNISENASLVNMMPNESIRFHIEVRDAGTASGSFMISRDAGNNTFKLIGKPHFSSTSCSLCSGTSDLGDITEDYNFIPGDEGRYRAEANYGGASKRIDILAYFPTTTSSSTTTTTSVAQTTSTSTSSSTTTSSTSSSTTSSTVARMQPVKRNLTILYVMGIAIVVLVFFFLLAKRR